MAFPEEPDFDGTGQGTSMPPAAFPLSMIDHTDRRLPVKALPFVGLLTTVLVLQPFPPLPASGQRSSQQAAGPSVQPTSVEVVNKDGHVVVRLGSDQRGNGLVVCYDANGAEIGRLPFSSAPAVALPVGPRAGGYAGVGAQHSIKENIDRGAFILLDDDSLWEVTRLETLDASLWMRLESIRVIAGDDPTYPYLLINTDTKDKVNARLRR